MRLRCVEGGYTGGYRNTGRGWPKTFDFGFSEKGRGEGGSAIPLIILRFLKP